MLLKECQIEDYRKCKVKVSLCTRKLEDLNAERKILQHWMLKFEFDSQTLYLEANKDDGILTPFVHIGKPANIQFESVEFLGYVNISLSELMKKARNNKYNLKRYDPLETNCQVWVDELCKPLGLSSKLAFNTKTVMDIATPVSILLGAPELVPMVKILSDMFSGSYNSGASSKRNYD